MIINSLSKRISSKLSVQLILSFVVMFVVVMVFAFMILYTGIANILKNKSEANTIQMFKQYEFNINRFCNDMDLVSRQLMIDADLQRLTMYATMTESDKVTKVSAALREFTNIINNLKYIDSIIYFGGDGLIIKSSVFGNYIQYDDDSKNDWFFNSNEYIISKEHKQKLIWFGGYSNRDFGLETKKNQNDQPEYYISASRNALQGTNTGTLVINIKESYFSSVYHPDDTREGELFLLSNDGIIISSDDPLELDIRYGLFSEIDTENDMGYSNITRNGESTQIVFYKLSNSIGILVKETLMSEILRDINYLRNTLLILFVFCFAAALLLSRFWVIRLMKPLNSLTKVVKKVGKGELGLTLEQTSGNEIGLLIGQFNQMSTSINDLFERNQQIQKEKYKLEMAALRSQINPHFIYNTLNTIKWMAVISKADNIVDSITTLSNFLEPVFKKQDVLCTLEEEISYTQNYVKIMNYRYAGCCNLHVDIPDGSGSINVLRFILQPVVENAIVHGMTGKAAGNVYIIVTLNEQELLICIKDDGEGMDESSLQHIRSSIDGTGGDDAIGIGLTNVHKRIRLHYGDKFGVSINSVPGEGTEVILRMSYHLS